MNDLALHTALHRDADLVGEPSPDLLDQLARRRQHQRRQRAGILAAAAAVVVVVGAGIPVVSSLTMRSDAGPAARTTIPSTPPATTEAAPPTSAAPTSSAAPAPSSEPTTAPATPDPEPAALVLGPDGLGPLELGMSPSEAEATGMVEPWDEGWPTDVGCRPLFRLGDDPAGTSAVWWSDTLGVAAIHLEEGVQTPEGITIGSPLSAVEQAYPGWDHSYHVLRGIAPVTGRPDQTYRIAFSKGGKVTELTLQYAMHGCYE
jgi:hypothetical protein